MKQPFFATHWSTTSIARVLRPMQEFIQQEQSSGLILLAMTVIALLIANSPLAGGYAGPVSYTHLTLPTSDLV